MNALIAFEAAARLGGFTRAAEELSVAQPAITRHVAKLEDWLDARLFDRRGNVLTLTEQGEELSRLATSLFDRMELGLRDVATRTDTAVVLGASFGVAHLWLMPRIGGLRAAANTPVTFVTSDDYRSFENPALDASIRFGNGEFGENASDLLFAETCQIIASPQFLADHPEFDPVRPTLTLPPEKMFDHGDPHQTGWTTWADFFRRDGQSEDAARGLTRVLSYPTMLDMIAAGEGVGVGYWGLEDRQVDAGVLVRIGEPIQREGWGYYLVYREERLVKPAFASLRDYLLSGA